GSANRQLDGRESAAMKALAEDPLSDKRVPGSSIRSGRPIRDPSAGKGRRSEGDPIVKRADFTVAQRVSMCFAAGGCGAAAVVLFSHVLFGLGISETLGVKAPVSLKSPDIYKPLFWGGLWGIPFGLAIGAASKHLYLFGLLYVLAPLSALFLIFLPNAGAGFFGLQMGGPL